MVADAEAVNDAQDLSEPKCGVLATVLGSVGSKGEVDARQGAGGG